MIGRIAIIAATAMAIAPHAKTEDVVRLSVAVAHVEAVGVDYRIVLATSHVETGGTFRSDLVSRAGACGPMQVMPRWSDSSCEQMAHHMGGVAAGVASWHYWSRRQSAFTTAELYNGGNRPGSRAKAYGIAWANIRNKIGARPEGWPLIRGER